MKWFLSNIVLETPNKEEPKEKEKDTRYYKTQDDENLTLSEELVACLMGRGLDGKSFFQPKSLKETMTIKILIDKLWKFRIKKDHQIELEDVEFELIKKAYGSSVFLQNRNPYIAGQVAEILEKAERKPEPKPEEKRKEG